LLRRRLAALLLALLLVPCTSPAQTFSDPGFAAQVVVTMPAFQLVGMAWTPDGAMFLWQKNGLVRVFRNGALLPTPFIDLRGFVNTYDDRGLLGLALDPDFDNNHYVYLAYVYEGGGNPDDTGPKISRLTRVTANPANTDVALPGSEVIILNDIPAAASAHTAGTIRFAPDGTLFLANGDGGTASFANTNSLNAQNIDSLSGKILRINPDGTAPAPPKVPNPFYDGTNSIRSKVYAYGLRNAFRYDFRPGVNDLYACDVGWNDWEEVDHVVPGANYGWPCFEGPDPQPDYQSTFPGTCGPLQSSQVTFPEYTYDHSVGSAAVGGSFYTGVAYPEAYRDNFFFADYTGGFMRRLVLNANGTIAQNLLFATDVGVPVSTEVGPDGLLYYGDFVTGNVKRILYNGPTAVASATPRFGYSPLGVSFSSAGSTGSGLSYAWAFGDGGTSSAASPSHTYTSATVQTRTAQLTVTDSSARTAVATVDVTIGSLPPNPSISMPADGVGVNPGTTVFFAGSATDPDESLPPSALSWQVLLHHNTHVHSFVGGSGTSGSFVAEFHGTGTYYYEVILTATDSSGLSASTSVAVPILNDTAAPTAPTNLTAAPASGNSIGVGWNYSTDNTGVTQYRIERCTGASCTSFLQVATSTTPAHTSNGLLPQTTYRFRVRAVDATGNLSDYSNIAAATTPSAPPPPSGLVAAYAFGEGAGTFVGDLSGAGNHGTANGGSYTPSGRYGSALAFNGLSDVVVVPDANSLDLTNGLTIEAWVFPTTTLSSWKAIAQKETDAYFLNANTGTNKVGMGGTWSGSVASLSGPNGLVPNQWTHVAGTYNGSQLRLYVNGAQVATQSRTGNLQVTGSPLRLGGNTYSTEYFPGRIDELRIYNRALSLAEIQSDMNTPLPEPGSLVALVPGAAALAWLRARRRRKP
jgi:glucose/arabinose dehydrogenase